MDIQKRNLKNLNVSSQIDDSIRSWVEIDKSAIKNNLLQLKKIVGRKVELAVVVKSNAYGHGLLSLVSICQDIDEVNWLCTFTLSESLLARANGFSKSILVLGYADEDLEKLVLQEIDIVAYDLSFIVNLNEIAKKLKKNAYIHIKVDTGLTRLGQIPEKSLDLIQITAFKLPYIKIRGIFSHFSESDANDQSYTNKQISTFNALLKKIRDLNINIPFIHASNTAGIIRFENCHYNFCRTGGGTYGLYKSAAIDQLGKKKYKLNLKMAMQWKTRIMQIKEVPVGTYVSYARTFITYRATRLAIVPVGYWDGYSRQLSNKGMVYIKNQPGFVIGRICMNMFMIDITDIKNVNVGDEVILLGNYPGITPDEIAQSTGSINYEVTTRINPSIQRIIV